LLVVKEFFGGLGLFPTKCFTPILWAKLQEVGSQCKSLLVKCHFLVLSTCVAQLVGLKEKLINVFSYQLDSDHSS